MRQMPVRNLNRLPIDNDTWQDATDYHPRQAKSKLGDDGFFEAYFDRLEDRLVEHIGGANLVVGCVAWLTNKRILRALADVEHGVSIIVQKEDFLRPDYGNSTNWKAHLRQLYNDLPCPPDRYARWGDPLQNMSYASDPTIQPVRCMGNHNKDKSPAFPRMHHKFLVFCHYKDSREKDPMDYMDGLVNPVVANLEPFLQEIIMDHTITPVAVWTGSFNFSENACNSMENAVFFNDPAVVSAYFNEWNQIAARSEPLDWTSEWAAPEWRLGS